MFFALVFYPRIEHKDFHSFRNRYEPYAELMREHIPFVFPVPESIGQLNLDFWRTIDHLTLVKVNPDFTACWDIKDFRISA